MADAKHCCESHQSGCGHEHHDHDSCGCGHEHHDHDSCGCGHEHHDHDGCGCGCGHDHGNLENLKKRIGLLIVGAVLFGIGLFLPDGWIRLVVFLASFLVTGGKVLIGAVKNILKGHVFDENFLMTLATIGAFVVGEYPEGAAVMLFFQVGELFQDYAVSRSRRSIQSLMNIRPDYANVNRGGTIQKVDPEDVEVGEQIIVKPGERVPLDGIVLQGDSFLDTSALTGESVPRRATEGDEVYSGCINQSGALSIQVSKPFAQSTVSRILELVEHASGKKANTEQFITKFARYYTPVVVLLAVLLAMIPPLVTGQPFSQWVYRALTFLVISCPCALVISIPLSFFGGIGGASKIGILVKGGNFLEALSHTDTVVFDKTGTLTKGTFVVTQAVPNQVSREKLITAAAMAEHFSNHPIARSIEKAYEDAFGTDVTVLDGDVSEFAGKGIVAQIAGNQILAGNSRLMEENGISCPVIQLPGTVVHCAENGDYLGYLVISDEIRPDAKQAIALLKQAGVKKTVMLTGDRKETAQAVAQQLGVDEVYAELLPDDKVHQLEQLLAKPGDKGRTAFVGDGINDAPVLARADIGIAMGGIGSDAAIEAADLVIMTDEPSKIAQAVCHARRTLKIVYENIIFALGIKLLVLILGALGAATMWEAVFADVGVSVIAILNAIRALKVKKMKF
ncbi:MAG: heavy metal translocating P-type ATPase [Massiliimalia sp.]|jgi:Cd2+/Zn2+-exporting ATPase